MKKKFFRSCCELVNTRRKPINRFRRVLASLQRLIFRFLNVGGFARSFRLLSDAFRSLRRLWVVFAFLALPFVCSADALDDKLDRIENSISNLTTAVAALQQQVSGLNSSVGGSLSTEVNDFGTAFDNFVTLWKKVIGANGPGTRTFAYAINNIQNRVGEINAQSLRMANALLSISNQLSQVDFEALTDSVGMIEQIVGDIYMDVYEIKGILQSMLELQDAWSDTHTNQLQKILDKIKDLTAMVSNVWGGGGGDVMSVKVEGAVDVGTVDIDSSGLFDHAWAFSGSYLKYLDRVAGEDKWSPDFIQTESASIGGEGSDYREGVMVGFQNLFDLHAQQLEASQRILLCLNPTNDLSDIRRDWEEKGQDGKDETDRVADEIDASKNEFLDFTWEDRLSEKVESAFSPFLEFQNYPSEGVKFTVPGGRCMGFEWETFTVDCSGYLNQQVAEFIRVWVLFIFYGGMIFLVLHLFPWGVARFATIVYYLSNINKNTGGG